MDGLGEVEVATLKAILERMIPADENGPGAAEAGVVRYVLGALGGRYSSLAPAYCGNLAALDRHACERAGGPFRDLLPPAQDAILMSLDLGDIAGFDPSSRGFVDLVRQHAVEGMFADPVHGGNAGFAGWKLIGFPGPKGTFTARDQELDTKVEAVWAD